MNNNEVTNAVAAAGVGVALLPAAVCCAEEGEAMSDMYQVVDGLAGVIHTTEDRDEAIAVAERESAAEVNLVVRSGDYRSYTKIWPGPIGETYTG